MFKKGSIRKIEVINFVTYDHVCLYPGPNLNMIIGPNGTGKSTIVASIILGLGGTPKIVGRGQRISEYVKHNCNEATIHITLQGDSENTYTKITRTFGKNDKTKWAINSQIVDVKSFKEFISDYNIQVDNLCQFLPQDRVQNFAKLNQQELLKATQIALCREDLIDKQTKLIEQTKQFNDLSVVLEKYDRRLKEARDANVRIEGKIANFNKRKTYMAQVQDIDRKIAWIKYDEVYEKVKNTKNDLKIALEILEKHQKKAKPMEAQIVSSKNEKNELQGKNNKIAQNIRVHENSIRNCTEKFESFQLKIRSIEDDAGAKIAEIEQRLSEIAGSGARIEEMKLAKEQLIEQAESAGNLQEKLKNLTSDLRKCRDMIESLQNRREAILQAKQSQSAQVRGYEHEIARLENVKQQKLEILKRRDQDAYQGVLWLRNNRHLFKGEVFEPMLLEINVLDTNKAKYVENVISIRDKMAFTCTRKDDMTLLIRSLREQRKLSVNILHSSDAIATQFQPDIPIEQLKQYGFYTYLNSLFTAPEPIMKYLCKTYKIHNIPVGNESTNAKYAQVPNNIRLFFSDNERFYVRYSKYTNEKITSQNVINSDRLLSISMDLVRLEKLNSQIQQFRNESTNCDEQLQELDVQLKVVDEKSCKSERELQQIRNIKQQIQSMNNRIETLQQRVVEMKSRVTSAESVTNNASIQIKRVLANFHQLQLDLTSSHKSLLKLQKKRDVNSIGIDVFAKKVALLENQIAESRQVCRDAELTANNIREAYADIKGQAKACLQAAKNLSDNYSPDVDGFDRFRQAFDKLTSDLRRLIKDKDQILTKIDCLSTADDQEVIDYEKRVALIDELQEKISKSHSELSKMTARIERVRSEWLEPLQELISEMNTRFATAFEKLGCAGEISLNTGEDERDFLKYGLRIKVTYRNGEPLQELNNVVQSGGERAVATAAFMLSLQELTPVPFRCVDEINQGMDAINERKIFELLVNLTSSDNTPQYFLITPKLVSNLKYSRTMMVHIVHNGPFVETDRKWFASKLCNPQAVRL